MGTYIRMTTLNIYKYIYGTSGQLKITIIRVRLGMYMYTYTVIHK